ARPQALSPTGARHHGRPRRRRPRRAARLVRRCAPRLGPRDGEGPLDPAGGGVADHRPRASVARPPPHADLRPGAAPAPRPRPGGPGLGPGDAGRRPRPTPSSICRFALPATPEGNYQPPAGDRFPPGQARDDPRWTRPLPWAGPILRTIGPRRFLAVIGVT